MQFEIVNIPNEAVVTFSEQFNVAWRGEAWRLRSSPAE